MLRHLSLLGLLALCGAAHADSIYKCSAGGKITYSSAPCGAGRATTIDSTAPASGAEADAATTLARQKALLAAREQERTAGDARQTQAAHDAARINRVSAGRQADCARMEQRQKKEHQRLAAEAAKVGGQGKIERDLDAEAMARSVDAACKR
jgi:hypothetical protein